MPGTDAIRIGAVALAVLLVAGSPVIAQEGETQQPTLEESWNQLLHYIRIGNVAAADSYAKSILNRSPEPKRVYQLAVNRVGLRSGENAQQVLTRGLRLPDDGLTDRIGQIMEMIDQGYTDMRRSDEEIQKSIELLKGTLEQVETGRKRLIESGEYALPRLIGTLSQTDDPNLRARVVSVLGEMPKETIRGLSMALKSKNPKVVRDVAGALGRIGYPWAAPRLKETLQRDDLIQETRSAVKTALIAVGGPNVLQKSMAEVWYEWAVEYYDEAESLMPDPREETAFVWFWNDSWNTVEKVAVPREIFNEVYAMRMSRNALRENPEFYSAVPLWVAAVVRREVQLPAGTNDPLLSADELHARDYVLSTSPKYLQQALARAMDDGDTEVAFMLIEGLAQTQASHSLVDPLPGGAQPLVAAMTYPSRRVRFLAAVSLGNARPQRRFAGDQLVLPTLALALRQTGQKSALLVGVSNEFKQAIRDEGFAVMEADSVVDAMTQALDSAGVDVFVLGPAVDGKEAIDKIRQQPTLRGSAVVIADSGAEIRNLQRRFDRVEGVGRNLDREMLSAGIQRAIDAAVGKPMDPVEGYTWAARAARAIETIGQADTIFRVQTTVEPLKIALAAQNNDVQIASADALAVIDSIAAQRAIAAAALDAGNDEDVRVEAFRALSRSLRRFGNRLTDDQAQAVVDTVIGQASRELRQAASQALGSMNLPSDKIKMLILSSDLS